MGTQTQRGYRDQHAGGQAFAHFSLDVFNRCENERSVLMTIDAWAGVHPLLKTLPVDWEHKMPYGVLHAPRPSPAVERFLEAVKAAYC